MSLTNIKKMKAEQGFTIVELLVVIIVIAILAAIIIVAYNGITSKANTTAAQSIAGDLAKKIEAYNAATGAYPVFHTVGDLTTQLATDPTATLTGTGIVVAYPPTSANGKTTVQVELCGAAAPANGTTATGYKIDSWNYTSGSLAIATNSGGVTTACSTSTSGS